MTKNIGTKVTQNMDFLTSAAIDIRYLAGDLSSWADEILSPRADIKTLTNRLDNCIAKLLATRRATPWISAAGELAHGTSKSAGSSGQGARGASANLPKSEIMSRPANPQTAIRILSNPASRSAFRSSMSSRPTEKRKAGPGGFHAVALR